MDGWQKFLDSLDSQGGHILIMICFVIVFALLGGLGVFSKGESYMGEMLTLLAYAMRGNGRAQPPAAQP